jgi:hypothetical protein
MRPRDNGKLSLRSLAGPIERLAQANLALILTQAVIIRLSVDLARSAGGDPDPLLLLGFLAACAVAAALVVVLRRVIRRFPRHWLRVALALGTVALQAAAFQWLHAWAS